MVLSVLSTNMKNYEKKIEIIVDFIKKYLLEAKAKGIVFGISGGIDSALIGAIASKYFKNNHLALTMNINNSLKDIEDGKLVINHFDLNHVNVNLDNVYKEFCKVVPNIEKGLGNLKARIRMNVLYSYAVKYDYLVVGTSNADEFITGYFTKYGDSGSDIMPLVNLTKKSIYECAKLLNVPNQIILKKPTAGLFENQSDEEDLKVSYNVIDSYLEGEKIDHKDKERIEYLKSISEHKRKFPPSPLPKDKLL